uniref:Uncharacterized protein n=1 Tax=Titanophycus setchellii TaxID=940129 RepID=A0A1G4NY36_9FLOR|nr:Hypothetical protein ycf37 [Titanophycus setchellii]SCW23524.1 Hypothetical protein ycf37 [Titanophycus setchellii]
MPTIYLICLSLILTPLTILLITQNIRFYKYEQPVSKLLTDTEILLHSKEIKHYISQIYIQQHRWLNAIILLENLTLEEPSSIYSYQISSIMTKNLYNNLAEKYQQYSQKIQ